MSLEAGVPVAPPDGRLVVGLPTDNEMRLPIS
jgi:hypothetical protein